MNRGSLVPGTNGSRLMRPDVVFGSLQREVERLFGDFARATAPGGRTIAPLVPSMDISETDKEIRIEAELPGLERKDVEISVEDGILAIRGEKKVEAEQKDKDYHLSERSYGVFFRAIPLPQGIDTSAIQATMSNGVLTVTIPKPARPEPQKIEVKEAH